MSAQTHNGMHEKRAADATSEADGGGAGEKKRSRAAPSCNYYAVRSFGAAAASFAADADAADDVRTKEQC